MKTLLIFLVIATGYLWSLSVPITQLVKSWPNARKEFYAFKVKR